MALAPPLPADLQTPCLVVDRDVLEGNLVAMAERAGDHGLALRPHAKTHKCLEIARRQVVLGAVGRCWRPWVRRRSSQRRASPTFSSPTHCGPRERRRRLCALAERVSLRVGADSAEGVEVLARSLAGTEVEIVVEIDSGHHRTGVAPKRAGQVAAAAHRHGLGVAGVFTFPGHSYEPGSREQAAADEARALQEADAAHAGQGWARACAAADRRRPRRWRSRGR